MGASADNRPSVEELAAYYAQPREYNFATQCRMELLGDMRGKRVLDVDCRRGKGVIKLSDQVGGHGYALGVDPNPEFIAISLEYMDGAWRKNGLLKNNMAYKVAYPERLVDCGVPEEYFDMVFCNSSITLAYDPKLAFAEMFRVLRPGGTLIYDGAVCQEARDPEVVAQARVIGNAIQAAYSADDLRDYVVAAGFDAPEFYNICVVDADTGFKDDYKVPTVESDEAVTFLRVTARIYKPRY